MKRILFVASLALSAGPALAQNPQTGAPQNPVVPMAPQNAPTTPPERVAPSTRDGNLSNQLSRSHGTVSPPANVDPGMTVSPAPSQRGTMPVIPPPGTPGGNRNVVPK